MPHSSPTRRSSYLLDIGKLIAVAKRSGADAVHPGYGFLSERADFARAVIDAGLSWVGPNPETIDVLGDKVEARKIAKLFGVTLVSGTLVPVESPTEVLAIAEKPGLPIQQGHTPCWVNWWTFV